MRSALSPVLQAIVNRLDSYEPLLQAGFKTYDEPPASAKRYVLVGNGTQAPRATFSRAGQWITETLDVYAAGASSIAARDGAALVQDALEGEVLESDGVVLQLVKLEFVGPTLKEQGRTPTEPGWRHVPMRFRMWARAIVPIKPSALTITSITPGDEQLSVAYALGELGSHPLSDIEASLDEGGWFSTGSVAMPVVIGELVNGVAKSVRLRAVTEAGVSPPSNSMSGTPRTVPEAPTIDSATPGDNVVTLVYSLNGTGGSAITGVELSINGGAWNAAGPSPLDVPGSNGVPQSHRLRALNVAGESDPSDAVSATPRTVPDAPVLDSVTPDDEELIYAFTAGFDGGSPITGVQRSHDGGPWVSLLGGTVSPLAEDGLDNGTPYSVRLRFENAAGFSDPSNAISGTPRTVPDAPSLDSLTPGNNLLTVDGTLGGDGGSPITDLMYRIDGGAPVSAGVTDFPFDVPGVNGTPESVEVAELNAAGFSDWSNLLSETPYTVPDAPTLDSLTPSDSTLTVAGTAGFDGGSPVTDLQYRINGGAPVSSGGATFPFDIGSLTNGTPYDVETRYGNAAGFGDWSNLLSETPSPGYEGYFATILGFTPKLTADARKEWEFRGLSAGQDADCEEAKDFSGSGVNANAWETVDPSVAPNLNDADGRPGFDSDGIDDYMVSPETAGNYVVAGGGWIAGSFGPCTASFPAPGSYSFDYAGLVVDSDGGGQWGTYLTSLTTVRAFKWTGADSNIEAAIGSGAAFTFVARYVGGDIFIRTNGGAEEVLDTAGNLNGLSGFLWFLRSGNSGRRVSGRVRHISVGDGAISDADSAAINAAMIAMAAV